MRQKFEMDGDHVELILSYPGGDIFRAPLATLLSMTTLNDGELLRFSYQPPAPDPFDAESPTPDRVHCTVRLEVTPPPQAAEVLVLAAEDEDTVRVILDPTSPPPAIVTAVHCSDCNRPFTSADDLAEHRRYVHPAPRRLEGNTARIIGNGTGPASRLAHYGNPGGQR